MPFGVLVAVALALFVPLEAAMVAPTDASSPTVAGQFLVALEDLRDPRFVRTVIYMLKHDGDGAMGVVVNRPLGDLPAADLLARFGLRLEGVTGTVRVHYGGPVEPRRGFVLHTTDRMLGGSHVVSDGVAFTGSPDMLESIVRGTGPRRSLVALGYAGWAPGQLESEIRRGSWTVVPADPELLFSEELERTWERALARRKLHI